MTDQLNSLRRAFDERLTALEAGLAEPDPGVSIETLVLELTRIAGDEADAAARQGVLLAQRDANAQTAAAVANAQQAHALLDGERSRSAALRTEIATLKEHLATAVAARRDLAGARQREAADTAAAALALREELAAAVERTDAATRENSSLAVERDGLLTARDSLLAERDRLSNERADLMRARETDAGKEREMAGLSATLAQYREALEEARRAIADSASTAAAATARADAAMREREILVAERADFVRTHDAFVLQRDTLVHERDDLVRERDKEIARLRDEIAAASAAPPERLKQASKARLPSLQIEGPERKSDRQAFSSALGVQIDGEAALLVNLSVTGAQVLSCSSLKPAKTVKMLLPSHDSPVLCRGRIVWARLEPTTPGKPIRYRAGMFFTATDQAAVQTFITRHGARQ